MTLVTVHQVEVLSPQHQIRSLILNQQPNLQYYRLEQEKEQVVMRLEYKQLFFLTKSGLSSVTRSRININAETEKTIYKQFIYNKYLYFSSTSKLDTTFFEKVITYLTDKYA